MRSRLARILLLLIVIGTCKSTCVPARAQESEPAAKKVAELNDESYEMYCSVLDTFIDHLKQDKASHGVIIVYGPEGNRFGTGDHLLREETDYIKGVGGFPSDRLTSFNYGVSYRAPWTTTELWIVPPGAKMSEPVKRPVPTVDFSGKVGHEVGVLGDVDLVYEGPSSYGVPMAAFAQMLRRQPDSVGYLVAHQMADEDRGTWRVYAKHRIKVLKSYGVDPARVKIIHGRTSEYPKDELWILSKGEHLPTTN